MGILATLLMFTAMGEIFKKAVNNNTPFWVLTITAIILLFTSLILPPLGIIDNSVIKGIAELIGIGALWCLNNAILKGYDTKVSKGDVSIEVTNNDK